MIRLLFIVVSLYVSTSIAASKCLDVDLILTNGTIYSGLNDRSFVGTIASKESKIIYVGDILPDSLHCAGAKVINLSGKYIYPGFTDAHGPVSYTHLTLPTIYSV